MNINTFFIADGAPVINQLVGGVVVYFYLAYTVMVLAQRLGTTRPWLSWIPLANLYLMTQMAGLAWWWLFGVFVPFVNFLVAGYIWSEIGKKFNKPWWVGALVAFPPIGIFVPGYLVITTGAKAKPREVHNNPTV